jgi:hypothetical protein
MSCGYDLARERVSRDPHYDLPMVKCPRCRTLAVRTIPQIVTAWKRFVRLDWTMSTLLVQCIACGLITLGMTICTVTACELYTSLAEGMVPNNDRLINAGIAVVLFAGVIGTWLTVAFHHWPRGLQWPVWWCVWIIGVHFIPFFAFSPIGVTWPGAVPTEYAEGWGERMRWLWLHVTVPATMAVSVLILLSISGVLPGLLILRGMRLMQRMRWRQRRRRLRNSRIKN